MISGDVPIMGMSGQPVISARARGADLTMFAGMVNKMNYILVTSAAIKKPEDLKGKRIGAAQAGTASYHAVLLGLKHWGLDARRDRITILQLGNQAARVGSLAVRRQRRDHRQSRSRAGAEGTWQFDPGRFHRAADSLSAANHEHS